MTSGLVISENMITPYVGGLIPCDGAADMLKEAWKVRVNCRTDVCIVPDAASAQNVARNWRPEFATPVIPKGGFAVGRPTPDDIPLPKFGSPQPPGISDDNRDIAKADTSGGTDIAKADTSGGTFGNIVKVDMAVQISEKGMVAEQGAVWHGYSGNTSPTASEAADMEPPPMPFGYITGENALCSNQSAIADGINVPSVGSIGHPHTCAIACKYFRKAWGCKRGSSCHHCHLCSRHHLSKWRRPQHSTTDSAGNTVLIAPPKKRGSEVQMKDAQVDTEELEFINSHSLPTKSLGSVGHPYRCAPACRYTWRKGGCNHGQNCFCCHLCHWVRLP
jgi:hypothetical protein